MSHITLVRHGQANTQARDETGYDRLSPLGHQQAAWLGDHLRASASHHPRVYCGTLTRHIETASGMNAGDAIRDARLNELEYFTLAQLLEEQHGVALPSEREGFIRHLPRIFTAWQNGELEGAPETFDAFESRVTDALTEIAAGRGPALVVTSGGLIAIALRQMMELNIAATARVALAIMNTSMHRLFPIGDHLSPVLFNAVPHLETPDRHFAQTHF
ncbi:histidine phosphatase family protein [Sedimentitalea sp. JM2-8]|uniref:Histidine phosphatase family protein n=1 Tax=Sedimentitalea xiamensis TaxID=3050037 RepID=A0ABT7FH29_9RHOB|nr:histidine phosphatase family protein [Sedimentitalea xiamensis]MDK3074253.1 histidine phosphatase family protein [Sedimentitalea xiamensis]